MSVVGWLIQSPRGKRTEMEMILNSVFREMVDWKKHKLESRLPGEISITSDMQMTPPLW